MRKSFEARRYGYSQQRKLTVGSGTIKVKVPRVSDVPDSQEPFASRIVKPYQRRSETLKAVFPKLFIEGLATRDFEPSLRCLMGEDAALSPSTISRLNQRFKQEYEDWTKSSLSSLPIVYVWVDGIFVNAGLGDEKACLLVVSGADTAGKKHLLALSRRLSGVKRELVIFAQRVESARDERACGSHGRWGIGLSVSGQRGVAVYEAATMLDT